MNLIMTVMKIAMVAVPVGILAMVKPGVLMPTIAVITILSVFNAQNG